MVVPTVGLTQFASAMSDEATQGQAGTGTTSPALGDTALETPLAATKLALDSSTPSSNTFQTSHTIDSTTATGNTFTEWAVLAADDTLLSRAVTAGVTHTSSDEITKITTFTLTNE
jgi:hypothetical protein